MTTIGGLFERMYRVQLTMEDYTAVFTPAGADPNAQNETEKQLSDAIKDLQMYLRSRVIFLPEALYQEVFRFYSETEKKAHEYQFYVRQRYAPDQTAAKARGIREYVVRGAKVVLDDIKASAKELIEVNSPDQFAVLMAKKWAPKEKPGDTPSVAQKANA